MAHACLFLSHAHAPMLACRATSPSAQAAATQLQPSSTLSSAPASSAGSTSTSSGGLAASISAADASSVTAAIPSRSQPTELAAEGHDSNTDEEDQHKVRRGGRQDAVKGVAASIAWFGLGGGGNSSSSSLGAQHLFQHQRALSQQMSLEEWQALHQQQMYEAAASEPAARMSRWRRPQRREWLDRVVSRALSSSSTTNNSSGGGQQNPQQQHHIMSARDHIWRSHQDGGAVWTAPVRHVTGALQAAQRGVCGCVEAVQATGQAAVSGVQRAGVMLVTPVQHAVQRMVSERGLQTL